MKVILLGRTFKTLESLKNDYTSYINTIAVGETEYDAMSYAGMAAGICYEQENFENVINQDEEKFLKRAVKVSDFGHYSCFEHFNVTFYIECPKIMCMVLNNLKFYSTSERSGRYTVMTGVSEKEQNLYDKWLNYFKQYINLEYGRILTPNTIEKLAQENARYMLSIFTPTSMIYSVPYSRALLTAQYLIRASKDKSLFKIKSNKSFNNFESELIGHSEILGKQIIEALGISKYGNIENIDCLPIQNIKNVKYPLFSPNNYIKEIKVKPILKNNYYGDTYTTNYMASFVQVAQAQRHRTLNYSIDFHNYLDNNSELNEYYNPEFYIPEMIKGRYTEKEWLEDLNTLLNDYYIIPNALKVHVTEQGTVENFILKCTERMCNQAQLEIANQTNDTLLKYYTNCDSEYAKDYLSLYIKTYINNSDINTKRRCETGYRCINPSPFCTRIFFNEGNKLV